MIYQRHELGWREAYNPLRGLTMSRLSGLLEEGERGAYADLQWLYRMVEKRDAVLRAGKRLRSAALSQFDWETRVISGGSHFDEKLANEQADCLREAYENIDNLKQAIEHLGSSEFRGYAHLEKHYSCHQKGKLCCVHLEPVPQWLWVRKGVTGDWEYNREARSGVNFGEGIESKDWVIRETEDPIDEIAVISFLRRNLSQKDWDGFVETYGIPPLFAEMPANIPSDRVEEYQALAEAVISDARGTLPNGARITTVDTGGNGSSPFRDHIEYQDSLVVMAMTSGKLKMLNDATGLGGGQAGVHENTFLELARAEARVISEIFQKQFDAVILDEQFPGSPVQAYWELSAKDSPNVNETIEQVSRLTQAGFKLSGEQISEMTGFNVEDPSLTKGMSHE